MKKTIKISLYFLLEILFVGISLFCAGVMLSDAHQSGEICITPSCGAQIRNYLEFGWDNYFHWFRKDEREPCRYQTYIIVSFYFLILPLYTGLKVYAKSHCPKMLSWKIIALELGLYVALYLYFLFHRTNFIITFDSFGNACLGAVRFFLPLIIYGGMIVGAFRKEISELKTS